MLTMSADAAASSITNRPMRTPVGSAPLLVILPMVPLTARKAPGKLFHPRGPFVAGACDESPLNTARACRVWVLPGRERGVRLVPCADLNAVTVVPHGRQWIIPVAGLRLHAAV